MERMQACLVVGCRLSWLQGLVGFASISSPPRAVTRQSVLSPQPPTLNGQAYLILTISEYRLAAAFSQFLIKFFFSLFPNRLFPFINLRTLHARVINARLYITMPAPSENESSENEPIENESTENASTWNESTENESIKKGSVKTEPTVSIDNEPEPQMLEPVRNLSFRE